jgi:protein TonB
MISFRGIAMSLVVHGVAAALVSVSAAIQPNTPEEDVAAIPVELVLEMESAPVIPSAPVQEAAETPVAETPEPEVVETPVQEVVTPAPVTKPEPAIENASLSPPIPPPELEPELVTKHEAPVQIPAAIEEKPAPPKKVEVMPRKEVVQKPATKVLKGSQKKHVAALAAGKGSLGKLRSTDGRAAEQSYNSKVLARLRAAKKYPAAARGKGIEGTAILSFTISSSGKLTSARVVKGAGHALLDSAVIAMARNAAPFPAFPQVIAKSQMTFRVPVQFKIN